MMTINASLNTVKRFRLISALILLPIVSVGIAFGAPVTVGSLGITVSGTPRQFVYTNKQAGTYYSEALAQNAGGWFGWFVNAEKIMHEYELSIDGRAEDRSSSTVTVYPDHAERAYADGTRESFMLVDSLNAMIIDVRSRSAQVTCALSLPDQFSPDTSVSMPARAWKHANASSAALSSVVPSSIVLMPYRTDGGIVFVVSAGFSTSDARRQADSLFTHRAALAEARRARMDRVLARAAITTNDPQLTRAFAWAALSMDALIMHQAVNGVPTTGIFAGLPWFNNYWGRDSFISLPGATYVIGNFADAKDVLRSYARFQETNPASTNYGRIPNLATPTSVQYNTADGTPWFVKGVYDYVRTSNDTGFYREMYPVILRAIEGTLRYHTDSLLFLTHADAETWMDAVGPEGPWSPRGTRANDIQALWWEQLATSAAIASSNRDTVHEHTWKRYVNRLAVNFQQYFVDSTHGRIYDHLNANGTHSDQVRPNELFCFRVLGSALLERRVTERMLSQLVYEHGVGTLAQTDSGFTPYHHYEPHYVQDAAYHNGIVWTWLNGAAVHAAVLCDYQDVVYPVTLNLVHQILDRGCVGALSELLDAHVRPGEREPRLSGTYTQAWSLAEFIRSMYEDYLGVHFYAETHQIILRPRLPGALTDVTFPLTTPDGPIYIRYQQKGGELLVSPRSEARSAYRLIIAQPEGRPVATELPAVSDSARQEESREFRVALPAKRAQLPELARPVLMPYLKALKGPSYPLLPLSTVSASNPSAAVLFDTADSVGDDKGPSGTYTYPSSVHLKSGSLDLTHARVRYDQKMVYFTLTFRALSNPGWHPEYGSQLTLAAIAIHRSPGDTAIHVGANAHMTLDRAHAFDRLLVLGGGYRLTDASGTVLCEYRPSPEDVKHPMADPAARTIEVAVPVEYLGMPNADWKMTIMVGAQDDHGGAGVGEFRAVDQKGGEWIGGGKADASMPNVYDVLVLEH